MDYVKFAETIRPLYLLNDWKIAKEPGSESQRVYASHRLGHRPAPRDGSRWGRLYG